MTDENDSSPAPASGGMRPWIITAAVVVVTAIVAAGLWWAIAPPAKKEPAPVPVAKAPTPPPPPAPPPPPPPLELDSSPAAYPISIWQLGDPSIIGGKVEMARIVGRSDANAQTNLRMNDLVELSGWAGDPVLGMRVNNVLLSACDQIFASVNVGGDRPDIAKDVHRNLGKSGWTARFLVAHIPRCANTEVRVWSAAPGRPLLLPFESTIPLPAEPLPVDRLPVSQSRGALTQPPSKLLEPMTFTINPGPATMRSCGGDDCQALGTLGRGAHAGFIVEPGAEWSLLAVGQRAGWVSNATFKAEPYAPQSATKPAAAPASANGGVPAPLRKPPPG